MIPITVGDAIIIGLAVTIIILLVKK